MADTVIVKKANELPHHIKHFNSAESDRVILPGIDQCRVKVTRFKFEGSFRGDNIMYPYDETVFVVSGELRISWPGKYAVLHSGDIYHVPAGTTYSAMAIQGGEAICVFSAGSDGILPNNE